MKKGKHGDVFEDDGVEFEIVDSEKQALSFRVGVVNYGYDKQNDGLWVDYQKEKDKSSLSGPVLISESTWKELKKFVDAKFRQCKRKVSKKGGRK